MIEESPESFISRWRAYAADVEMFAHTEGSPLLECRVGDTVLQLFERTGPYLSRPGPTRLIINPTAADLERLDDQAGPVGIHSHGLSNIVAIGRVTAVDDEVVVIDAGVPLVVSLSGSNSQAIAAGDLVRLRSEGPVHGFVVTQANGAALRRAEAVDERI